MHEPRIRCRIRPVDDDVNARPSEIASSAAPVIAGYLARFPAAITPDRPRPRNADGSPSAMMSATANGWRSTPPAPSRCRFVGLATFPTTRATVVR